MEVNNYFLLLPVLLPIIAGILLMVLPRKKRKHMLVYVGIVLVVDLLLTIWIMLLPEKASSLELLTIMEGMKIYFHVDTISRIFVLLVAFMWLMAGLAAFEYMVHEKNEARFYCFYLIVGGVLSALCFAGNLLTLYIFYELMTLTSMPLVMHSQDHGAIMAGLKYLFYSMGGALLVLFGLLLFLAEGNDLVFTAGGVLQGETSAIRMVALFLMILGFGTKAGMFPMHGWLPTAHPVAPAPASAVLSGVITKAGVLGIIRTVFFIAGADMIRGTWVQYLWILFSLVTIFMGSMLAYSEKVLKKRLAYSTVSQVSYILFGLSVLHPTAFIGAIMHVVFHSLVKNTLFISAGAIIYKTGRTKVDELTGIGKEMPVTMWCFTLVSLTLVGIPPTSAFVSKWYLAIGAMESGVLVSSWLGPIILLVSALLTAGYLLTISIKGFLPGADYDYTALKKKEPGWMMLVPMVTLTALAVVFGIWPTGLMNLINDVAVAVF
ncbi:MAG: proton-conducting membrane transporter [Clostridiales bacterium]|nr:proton-conducting membrane transporter [Clostridiales bacterium]